MQKITVDSLLLDGKAGIVTDIARMNMLMRALPLQSQVMESAGRYNAYAYHTLYYGPFMVFLSLHTDRQKPFLYFIHHTVDLADLPSQMQLRPLRLGWAHYRNQLHQLSETTMEVVLYAAGRGELVYNEFLDICFNQQITHQKARFLQAFSHPAFIFDHQDLQLSLAIEMVVHSKQLSQSLYVFIRPRPILPHDPLSRRQKLMYIKSPGFTPMPANILCLEDHVTRLTGCSLPFQVSPTLYHSLFTEIL